MEGSRQALAPRVLIVRNACTYCGGFILARIYMRTAVATSRIGTGRIALCAIECVHGNECFFDQAAHYAGHHSD